MIPNYTSTHSPVNTHLHYVPSHNCSMSLRENLKRLMDKAEENPYSLASKTKVTQPTIYRIIEGETLEPKQRTIERLAAFFGLTPDQLRNSSDPVADCHRTAPATPQPQLSADEQTLLAIYRGLSPAARANAITEMEVLQVRDKRAGAAAPERQPALPKDPPSGLCPDRRAQ